MGVDEIRIKPATNPPMLRVWGQATRSTLSDEVHRCLPQQGLVEDAGRADGKQLLILANVTELLHKTPATILSSGATL